MYMAEKKCQTPQAAEYGSLQSVPQCIIIHIYIYIYIETDTVYAT